MDGGSDGEKEPLLPEPWPPSSGAAASTYRDKDDDGRPWDQIESKESVFNFLIFIPPVSFHDCGHYYTRQVLVALLLCAVTVTLQIGLTVIAGNYLSRKGHDFRTSLLSDGASAATPLDETIEGIETMAGEVKHIVEDVADDIPVPSIAGAVCCAPRAQAGSRAPLTPSPGGNSPEPVAGSGSFLGLQSLPMNIRELLHHAFGVGDVGQELHERRRKGNLVSKAVNGICSRSADNMLTCTPPTYLFLDLWDELDTNADGKWSLKEAKADDANLGCLSGLPVEEVFRGACRSILKDAADTANRGRGVIPLVPRSIQEREEIPKAYFDWWRGFVVLCSAVDADRCSDLIEQGLFDGTMDPKVRDFSHGGVVDLDSALDYCQRLLGENGLCDQTLPGSYTIYRSRVQSKCGTKSYTSGARYTNTWDPRDTMGTVHVSYSVVSQYMLTSRLVFQFFLALILMLWHVNLLCEFKAILQLGDFVWNFPTDNNFPLFTPKFNKSIRGWKSSSRLLSEWSRSLSLSEWGEASEAVPVVRKASYRTEESGSKEIVITSIPTIHRLFCLVMFIFRAAMIVFMWHIGTAYLLSHYTYDDLLLNAVALAFIFELPEFLFMFVVSEDLKSSLRTVRPLRFPSSLQGACCHRVLAKPVWGLLFAPLAAVALVIWNDSHFIRPAMEALRCACLQEGNNCVIAPQFAKAWWDDYWAEASRTAEAAALSSRGPILDPWR